MDSGGIAETRDLFLAIRSLLGAGARSTKIRFFSLQKVRRAVECHKLRKNEFPKRKWICAVLVLGFSKAKNKSKSL